MMEHQTFRKYLDFQGGFRDSLGGAKVRSKLASRRQSLNFF